VALASGGFVFNLLCLCVATFASGVCVVNLCECVRGQIGVRRCFSLIVVVRLRVANWPPVFRFQLVARPSVENDCPCFSFCPEMYRMTALSSRFVYSADREFDVLRPYPWSDSRNSMAKLHSELPTHGWSLFAMVSSTGLGSSDRWRVKLRSS
jgi:hypothetical protein